MHISKLINYLWAAILYCGLPVVSLYHAVQQNSFLSFSRKEASGIEKYADTLLMPVHYIIAGQTISKNPYNEGYQSQYRFDYHANLTRNTFLSTLGFSPSLAAGYLLKGLAFYLNEELQKEYDKIDHFFASTTTHSNIQQFIREGISFREWDEMEEFSSLGLAKSEVNTTLMKKDLELFKEIVEIFKKNDILFWLDCGSCLGAYRYGGIIPWDDDLDMAVLLPDFDNIQHALQTLDKKKYQVQDWSSRLYPKSYIRVYHKETNNHIDIYHFRIDSNKAELQYLLANEDSDFMPEFWKIRERRFKVKTPISTVFPLKKMQFEGIEVSVPKDIEGYLQARYGEDLRPAKLYNATTDSYEKDLSHPYWQKAHVH